MNTLSNPTKEQVKEFCRALEVQLCAAIDRGADLKIGSSQVTKDVYNVNYGPHIVIDAIYIGAKFVAQFRERGF